MKDLFIIEGITTKGNILYYDAEDDSYYSGFKNDIAGATIFDEDLYRLFYNDIKVDAKGEVYVFYKRSINLDICVHNREFV